MLIKEYFIFFWYREGIFHTVIFISRFQEEKGRSNDLPASAVSQAILAQTNYYDQG